MMAATQDPQNSPDAESDLKKGLLRRVAVAGVLVVALLGGLAVFDALQAPPADKVAVAPPPVAEAKSEEATQEEAKPEAPVEEKKADEPPAEPERTAAASGILPAAKPERPLTVPAQARPASIRPAEPVLELHRPDVATEVAKTTGGARLKYAEPSRPLTRAAERSRQYVLQMGVFNNVANAEELRAKLELAGVPTQIEARVQVGPFSSRQEAESAREKLRALGMEGGFLTALRK
jgi:DedD protein